MDSIQRTRWVGSIQFITDRAFEWHDHGAGFCKKRKEGKERKRKRKRKKEKGKGKGKNGLIKRALVIIVIIIIIRRRRFDNNNNNNDNYNDNNSIILLRGFVGGEKREEEKEIRGGRGPEKERSERSPDDKTPKQTEMKTNNLINYLID